MISKLSKIIVSKLSDSQVISYEDKDLYIYGYFILLSHLYFFVFTIIIGLIFNILPESILFYLSFTLIRSYAGGIHAKTELICMICTSVSILLSMVAIKLCYMFSIYTLLTILMSVATFVIIIFSPLDTKEKRLDEYEKKTYGKKAKLSAILIFTLAFLFGVFDADIVLFPFAMSLTLEGILLIIGKVHDIKEVDH